MSLQTKLAVKQSWDSYQRIVLAVQADPETAADPQMKWALQRAHDRWAKAFNEWDGR